MNTQQQQNAQDFDELFQKLVEYKEENGDCMVNRRYQDKQVSFMILTVISL